MLDEYGLCDISSSVRHTSHTETPWIEEEDGHISRFRMPDGKPHQKMFVRMPVSGRELMYETLAAAWFRITTTCVKHANKNSKAGNEENQCQDNQSK